jgi:hypothetical protein
LIAPVESLNSKSSPAICLVIFPFSVTPDSSDNFFAWAIVTTFFSASFNNAAWF